MRKAIFGRGMESKEEIKQNSGEKGEGKKRVFHKPLVHRKGKQTMRYRIWWEDIRDWLYHEDRLIGAIDVGWLKIVEDKKNFFVVEGDKETIEYVREKRTELQKAIDLFLKKKGR